MRILLLPQAQEDLAGISEPLLSKVVHRLQVLKEFPELGSPMMGPFSGYRGTVADLFRILYRILPSDTLEVAYIRDCRRRPIAP